MNARIISQSKQQYDGQPLTIQITHEVRNRGRIGSQTRHLKLGEDGHYYGVKPMVMDHGNWRLAASFDKKDDIVNFVDFEFDSYAKIAKPLPRPQWYRISY